MTLRLLSEIMQRIAYHAVHEIYPIMLLLDFAKALH